MKRLVSFIAAIAICVCAFGANERISRVEPPCWWVGMETPLTLMVYGENLAGATVTSSEPEVTIAAVHNAQSPNYLFIDVRLSEGMKPGKCFFTVTTKDGATETFPYSFEARREGSARRLSFGPADVIYLLVADRFSNGDRTNDSSPLATEKANRENLGGRHGGDLKGIMNKLDYLSDLGITCIWPIPILFDNEASYSYHGYACADYYMVDPRYGTNELYKELVSEAHKKGIKFIQDLVINHCGTAHWWMKDLPFEDWLNQFDTYTRTNAAMSTHSDPHASTFDKLRCTEGWFDTTMADMNMKNPYLLQYFTQWAVWWVEYADLDGLRVDTYPYSDRFATAQWTLNILKEYPNLTIVGECWFHEATEIAYWEGGKRDLCGTDSKSATSANPTNGWEVKNRDGFTCNLPMVMDFRLHDALYAFLENDTREWEKGMKKVYTSLSLDEIYTQPYNMLVFMANHDTNRPAYVMESNVDRMKNMTTLILTTRGTPQLYYGDEVMLQSADGTTGHSQERRDFPGGWKEDKVNLFKASGRSGDNAALFNHTRTLLNFRKGCKAITGGLLKHFFPTDGSNFYVYFRYLANEPSQMVMVVINNRSTDFNLDWSVYEEMFGGRRPVMKDVLTGRTIKVGEPLTVPAMSSMVLQ